ncbi:MFS monosaccharide transporter [Colletotrichum karsti]|uniref:MFS monosaccharide transporter n=1 Tax=Colletotrichum karsti TaxID=1095194 RepID=A0A9P6I402_9PEZI|nr:MFS monosaccharide transporter [Colletotrichum karsti]KAF9875420.1 MFS monosaccharide transporter [Colletotrichum karsti]
MTKRTAGHRGNSARSIFIGLAISLAGFVYGIDTGIIASTIAQKTFKLYMYGSSLNNASVRAGIVSGYYAGYAFGSGGSAYSMDKISRRWTLLLGATASVIGAILQTAAMNPAMMIVGLAMRERYDEAKKVMYTLHKHRGSEVVENEFAEMCSQIRLDAEKKKGAMTNFLNLFTRKYIRRTLLACLTVNMMKLSGSNIIQNYQSIMYNSLGYQGQTVLLIGGLYGFMAVIGQIINVFFVADHWTRRVTVISGSYCLAILLAVLTALSERFPEGSNPAGSRAGVAFIFLFAFAYSFFFNSVNWVLVAEIFPLDLRGVGVGFSVFTQSVTAIWLSYAASIAFDVISWKFYLVFIACNIFAGTIYFFFLPETRFLSLEEVAAKFGDEIFNPPAKDLEQENESTENDPAKVDKTGVSSDHVEESRK